MGKITENTCSLKVKSGKNYTFGIYSINTDFNAVGDLINLELKHIDVERLNPALTIAKPL